MQIYRIVWADGRPDEYYSSLAALYAHRTSEELGVGIDSLYSKAATRGYTARRFRIEPVELRQKPRKRQKED